MFIHCLTDDRLNHPGICTPKSLNPPLAESTQLKTAMWHFKIPTTRCQNSSRLPAVWQETTFVYLNLTNMIHFVRASRSNRRGLFNSINVMIACKHIINLIPLLIFMKVEISECLSIMTALTVSLEMRWKFSNFNTTPFELHQRQSITTKQLPKVNSICLTAELSDYHQVFLSTS